MQKIEAIRGNGTALAIVAANILAISSIYKYTYRFQQSKQSERGSERQGRRYSLQLGSESVRLSRKSHTCRGQDADVMLCLAGYNAIQYHHLVGRY